jgi:hypothetical protein
VIDQDKYSMPENQDKMPNIPTAQIPQRAVPARPNETSGLNIDEHVRIFDPNSQQVFLEKRA